MPVGVYAVAPELSLGAARACAFGQPGAWWAMALDGGPRNSRGGDGHRPDARQGWRSGAVEGGLSVKAHLQSMLSRARPL